MLLTYGNEQETFQGYLALPQSGHGPGVLALHAWWGLNEVFKSFCDRLAAEGYVVLAPNLFDGSVVDTIPAAETQAQSSDANRISRNNAAALDYLRNTAPVTDSLLGAVGFSFGAAWALSLAGSEATKPLFGAVVLFYGMGEGDFNASPAAFLGHFAEQDPYEDFEFAKGFESYLHSKGLEARFHQYPNTQHWFFESDRPEYQPEAAGLAWERTVAFLREKLETAT